MTKISPEFEVKMQAEEILEVSADVSFASNQFPKYKLGAHNQILEEPKEDNLGPSLKEVVEQETANLSEQHKRLSVRDLASKFDKNLAAAAAKLSDEVPKICHFWMAFILDWFFSLSNTHGRISNFSLTLNIACFQLLVISYSICHIELYVGPYLT